MHIDPADLVQPGGYGDHQHVGALLHRAPEISSFPGLPLEIVTSLPPTGAGAGSVTVMAACKPLPTVASETEIARPPPSRLVSANDVAAATPGAVALTTKLPESRFAVNTSEVASPDAFVLALFVFVNTPLGPVAGATKVTVRFGMGFPKESVTLATNGLA